MSAFESKKYSWRAGYSYRTPAETVGKVLENIEKRDGLVTAKSFLDESRSPESPTHTMFEWDNQIAAEKYRLHQSTCIINQIRITFDDDICAPAFVNVSPIGTAKRGEFKNIRVAMQDEIARYNILKNALSELKSFQKKYDSYKELSDVFDGIEKFERKIS